MSWFTKHGKSIALILGALATVVTTALTDNMVEVDEQIAIGVALANAVLVYLVPNLTAGIAKYAKGVVSVVLAVLTGLSGWMINGMAPSDWWALLVAAATAAGVVLLPSQQHQTSGVVVPDNPVPGTGSVG